MQDLVTKTKKSGAEGVEERQYNIAADKLRSDNESPLSVTPWLPVSPPPLQLRTIAPTAAAADHHRGWRTAAAADGRRRSQRQQTAAVAGAGTSPRRRPVRWPAACNGVAQACRPRPRPPAVGGQLLRPPAHSESCHGSRGSLRAMKSLDEPVVVGLA